MVKKKEYLLGVNSFNKPATAEGAYAVSILLMELILLDPGSDPLKPEMGVGIRNYRYAKDKIDELKSRIESQIKAYLTEFSDVTVEIEELDEKKIANLRITIDGTTYVYDSETAPIPISLEDLRM